MKSQGGFATEAGASAAPITSPRQVHDRLNQIQSLRADTGNPLAT